MSDDNIKVAARFRPMNRTELDLGGKEVVTIPGDDRNVEIRPVEASGGAGAHKFAFDHIFGPDSKQSQIYEAVGRPVVGDIFKGYNGTIFVYGQTGSGKSHTMMGPGGFCEEVELRGIIPRVVQQIFSNVDCSDPDIEYSIKVSYVEIYKEKIRDLLDPSKVNLILREDKGGKGVYIAEATEQYVSDPEEIFELMKAGAGNRAVSSTAMNDTSSRSHAIFSLIITQKHSVKLDQKTGKLYLVDLAGSEKVGKTKVEGQQLEEAKLINKSLSALGQVINALTDKKASHIPYRDSKLTRLLQDSLGGNSRTSLIICGSVSEYNGVETLSTLRFGQRAKSIKNHAKINRELTVGEYKILLAQMEKELQALRAAKGGVLAKVTEGEDAASTELQDQLKKEREAILAEKTMFQEEMEGLREMGAVKNNLIEQYRSDLMQYQEEGDAWDAECKDLMLRAEEVGLVVAQERRLAASRLETISAAHETAEDIGAEGLSLKQTLESIRKYAEEAAGAEGATGAGGEEEVANWKREREEAKKEDAAFRQALAAQIQFFASVDDRLQEVSTDKLHEAGEQLSTLRNVWATFAEGTETSAAEGLQHEAALLTAALEQTRAGRVVPRGQLDAAAAAYRKAAAEKDAQMAKLKQEVDRHVAETRELRNSLLKDLQSRCHKVIDLGGSLDGARDQFKQLMVASSNKALRQRVQLLEAQHEQQMGNISEIHNENSTLRLEFKLAERKLAIRNERIENLKTGLKEEKRHMKELRESANTDRAKLKQECARLKEELSFWKDKSLKAASAAAAQSVGSTGSKAGRIIKVLKGGSAHKHDTSPIRDTSPASQDDDAATGLA